MAQKFHFLDPMKRNSTKIERNQKGIEKGKEIMTEDDEFWKIFCILSSIISNVQCFVDIVQDVHNKWK